MIYYKLLIKYYYYHIIIFKLIDDIIITNHQEFQVSSVEDVFKGFLFLRIDILDLEINIFLI